MSALMETPRPPSLHRYAIALAIVATGISVCVSVIAGLERGGRLYEQLA